MRISIPQSRFAPLREPCYLGINGLLGFKNTLEFIKAGDWERAANGMLASKWAKQVGMRAIELSELMRKGH
jgi:lysozyme